MNETTEKVHFTANLSSLRNLANDTITPADLIGRLQGRI
jgi:hypothetical protein